MKHGDESQIIETSIVVVEALNSYVNGLGLSFEDCPHRMRTKSRLPSRSVTTSTGSVGQILYRGGRLCGGA